MFAPLENEEDGAEHLVADGDDGAFVTTPDDERLELRLEHGLGTTGGMGEFAEQATDVEVAFADVSGLAFAGRLVVAGADADPGRQAVRAAEGIHIGTDFDQQHGGDRLQSRSVDKRSASTALPEAIFPPQIVMAAAREPGLDLLPFFAENVVAGRVHLSGVYAKAIGRGPGNGDQESMVRPEAGRSLF